MIHRIQLTTKGIGLKSLILKPNMIFCEYLSGAAGGVRFAHRPLAPVLQIAFNTNADEFMKASFQWDASNAKHPLRGA
jgi:hypothetical protein